jgi:hypothetical protein
MRGALGTSIGTAWAFALGGLALVAAACGDSNPASIGRPSGTGGTAQTGDASGIARGGTASGGSNSAAGGMGTGGTVSAGLPCRTSLDCVGASNNRGICDTTAGQCVECVAAADCDVNHDCTSNRCVAFTPCKNSLDCTRVGVCDTQVGRCVECVADADCDAGKRCSGSACRTACTSDRQCTPQGLLCDRTLGLCMPPSGLGGATGAGGTSAGGAGGATTAGGASGSGGASGGAAGLGGSGLGGADGGATSSGGAAGAPSAGAWTPCTTTADCTDGRICSPLLIGSGGHGRCIKQCPSGTTGECDPTLPGAGALQCLAGYCEMSCPCPPDYECVAGPMICAYAK